MDGDIRVVAIDVNGDFLGMVDAVTVGVARTLLHHKLSRADLLPVQIMVGFMIVTMLVFGICESRRKR